MKTIKKIAKNSIFFMAGNILETLFNLIISFYLARYFGQSGFGKLSFLTVFFFFLGSADNQLIRPILIREMSRGEENVAYVVGNGLIIRGLVSVLAIILFWITIWFLKPTAEIVTLAFFTSIGLLITSLISSYETIFQAKLKMGNFIALNLLSKIFILVLIYIIAFRKGDLFSFYSLSLIPSIILLLQVKYYSGKIIKPKFEIDFRLWKNIFKESWPLGLTAVFIFFYHRIDQIILFGMKGPREVGLYSAAVRLAEYFTIVPIALMISALPLMSKYYKLSKNDFERVYQLSYKYLLIFIVPVASYFSIFSSNIISSIYGKGFSSSGPALHILIWAEVFVFMGVVNNAILIATNKQILDPFFTGMSAIINIVLNLILIPKYGFMGAAVASLFSYPVGPIMGYFIRTTRPYSRCMFYYLLKPLCASLLMAPFLYYIRAHFLISIVISI